MKNNIINIILILIIICESCNDRKDISSKFILKKEYYQNGNIKSIKSLINDSILEGTSKIFYKNGIIETKTEYHNNYKNGIELNYDSVGNLTTKMNWGNNIKTGEGFVYENGKIRTYLFYHDGKLFFKRNFLMSGGMLNDEGTGIVFSSIVKHKFKVGDKFTNSFILVRPPNCAINFYVFDFDSNDKMINPKELNLKGIRAKHETNLQKYGTTKFGYELLLLDSITNQTKKYFYGVKIPVE